MEELPAELPQSSSAHLLIDGGENNDLIGSDEWKVEKICKSLSFVCRCFRGEKGLFYWIIARTKREIESYFSSKQVSFVVKTRHIFLRQSVFPEEKKRTDFSGVNRIFVRELIDIQCRRRQYTHIYRCSERRQRRFCVVHETLRDVLKPNQGNEHFKEEIFNGRSEVF